MRDTVTISPAMPAEDENDIDVPGYAVIRFVADSPGVWLLHCHIEWHFAIGLGMAFIVGYDELVKDAFRATIPESVMNQCNSKY